MSTTDVSPPQPMPSPSSAVARPAAAVAALRIPGWARVAVVCAVLLGSAGVRAWQSRRIESRLAVGRQTARFDLDQIPMNLGPWKGESTKIDEQIARGTGADQIITRRYVNQDTGVAVEFIALYGPAADVYLHAPEICYPAAGFTPVAGPDDRTIDAPPAKAVFRSLVYAKGETAQPDRQEVYYTWWVNGRWSPEVGKQKHFERIPAMYKIHLSRRVTADEKRNVGNPCEALLQAVLPEFAHRLDAALTSKP
jgi:EpsI family protein